MGHSYFPGLKLPLGHNPSRGTTTVTYPPSQAPARFGTARRDQYGNRLPGEFDAQGRPLVTAADGLRAGGGLQAGRGLTPQAEWDKSFPGVGKIATAGGGDTTEFDKAFHPDRLPPAGGAPVGAAPAGAVPANPAPAPQQGPTPSDETVAAAPQIGATRSTVFGGTETLMPSQSGPRWVGSTSSAPPATNFLPGDSGRNSLASTQPASVPGAPNSDLQSPAIQHLLDTAVGPAPAKTTAPTVKGLEASNFRPASPVTATGPKGVDSPAVGGAVGYRAGATAASAPSSMPAGVTPQTVKNDIPSSAASPAATPPANTGTGDSFGYAMSGGPVWSAIGKAASKAVGSALDYVGQHTYPGALTSPAATPPPVAATPPGPSAPPTSTPGTESPAIGAATGRLQGSAGGGNAQSPATAPPLKRQFTVAPDEPPAASATAENTPPADTAPAENPSFAAGYLPPGQTPAQSVEDASWEGNMKSGMNALKADDAAAGFPNQAIGSEMLAGQPSTMIPGQSPENFAKGFVPAMARGAGGSGDKPVAMRFPGIGPAGPMPQGRPMPNRRPMPDGRNVPNLASGMYPNSGGMTGGMSGAAGGTSNPGQFTSTPYDRETEAIRGNDVAAREAAGMPAARYTPTGPGSLQISPTSPNFARGVVPPGLQRALRREQTAIAHHVGGARRGDKPVAVLFPGIGPAVINSGEKVVPTASGLPAVLNRDMRKKGRSAFGDLTRPLKRALASRPRRPDRVQTAGYRGSDY